MTKVYGEMGLGLWPAFLQSPVLTAGSSVARRGPSPASWSSDGKFVAFYWARDGVTNLWIVPADGGWPIQLTDDDMFISVDMNTLYDRRLSATPAWSPDGKKIAFSARYRDEKDASLWVVGLDGGPAKRLTVHPGSDRTPVWSPKGESIAFVCLRDNQDDIWVVPSVGGKPLQLTYDRFNDVDPHWSPDGKLILFSSQRSDDLFCQDICIFSLSDGEVSILTHDEKVSDRYPRWSPDGKKIVFISDRSGYDEVWSMNMVGKDLHQITPHTGQDKGEFNISPDGKWLAYESIRRTNIDIDIIPINGGSSAYTIRGNGLNTVPQWSPEGTQLLYLHSDHQKATDIWISKFPENDQYQLSYSMIPTLEYINLIEPQEVSFSGSGGDLIDALIYRPKNIPQGTLLPAILLIHGGPNAQHFNTWWPFLQYLVQRGYVILAPNCHGSMGYGRAFMDSNSLDWAGKDKEDWTYAVGYLKGLGYIDAKRIGIWGRSYGGYATVMGMTQLPDLFRAGMCHFGPTDLISFWDQTSVRYLLHRMMGNPFSNIDLYKERSAVPFVDNIKGPILFLHGDADRGVPLSQSEEMITALEQAGKVYEYKCYEGEGHGFLKPENVFDAASRIVNFLERNLRGS